jgi:hypothetical protein
VADKDPKATDPFAEFGGQADAFAEFGGKADDPFAEFGGQVAEPAEAPPVFNSVAADDPRLKLKGKTLPEHGIRQESTIGEDITSGFGGIAQGVTLNTRAPLDYATAAVERGLESALPIDSAQRLTDPNYVPIPRGATKPGLDSGELASDFDQSLEATSAIRKEAEEKARGLHAAGEITGTVGTAFLPKTPVGLIGKGAEWAGEKVGANVAGYTAKALAKLKGAAEVAPIRQGLFSKALGKTAEITTEAALGSAPFGAADALDKAYETKDWDSIGEKMLGGMRDEMITGVKYGAPVMGAIGLARKAIPEGREVLDIANGKAFKGLGGKKGDIALAEMRIKGGGNEVGRTLMDEGIITGSDLTLEGTAQRADVVRTLLGQELGKARAKFGGMGDAPSASGLMDKIEREVLAPAREHGVTAKEYKAFVSENKPYFQKLEANRYVPEYDSFGLLKQPKRSKYADGKLREATPEEITADMAHRQSAFRAPKGGTAPQEAFAGTGNFMGNERVPIPLDSMGQPLPIGDVPKSGAGLNITGVKPQPTTEVWEPGELLIDPDEISFDALNRDRIDIDQKRAKYHKFGQQDDVKAELYRKMRGVLDRHWMDAAEEAAKKSGNPEAIHELQVLKDRYAKVAVGSDLLNETMRRKEANRTFSLSDTLIGGTAASIGGAVGGAVSGGEGITPGALITGAAGGLANKYLRERGNFLMSTTLARNAKRAVKVQEAVKKAAKLSGLVSPKAIPAITVGRDLKEAINPEKVIDHAEKLQDPTSDEAQKTTSMWQEMEVEAGPEVVKALRDKMTAQNEFILEKAGPKPPPSPFGGPPPKRQIDPETEEQLSRYIGAMNDPSEALARVGDGQALPEDYEVLESQYPRLWEEFQQTAVQGLADKNLDYDQQLAVAGALKLPLHPSMQGDYMSFWQGMSANEPPPEPELPQQVKSVTAHLSGGENVSGKADRAMA